MLDAYVLIATTFPEATCMNGAPRLMKGTWNIGTNLHRKYLPCPSVIEFQNLDCPVAQAKTAEEKALAIQPARKMNEARMVCKQQRSCTE